MEKTWNILAADCSKVSALKTSLNINETLCRILVQRGFDDFDTCRNFFRPSLNQLHDPWLMKDMDKAVTRIQLAFNQQEKILVFGDYDVDGTTAVAGMYSFLCEIYDKEKLDFYVPHRYREGYGVSKAGIDFAHTNGYSLIICLDCGIKSVELISYAQTLSVDFIVCDHHLPGDKLPPAIAILNAKQPGCNYPYKELCGAGVGFKLMSGLTEALNLDDSIRFKYLDLLATAIAADIVPMTGENRVLAYFGLRKINENPSAGIKALMQLAATKPPLTITNVVFVIAPRINAAGRMDDARKAIELFVESDFEKALGIAATLHSDNNDRKEKDKEITEQALEILLLDASLALKKTTVVYREDWHKGVVGIVASRLIEKHYRPTVVLTRSGDFATGSARSVTGFNLYEAIYACREYLVAYGGHFAAAGLSMLPEHVAAFTEKFESIVAATIEEKHLKPGLVIDAELSFAELSENFFNIICQMEPFGPENMKPVFISRNVTDNGYSKLLKDKHVRFVLQQRDKILTGIGFDLAEKFHLLKNKQRVDIVYCIDENEWQGTKTLQLKIIDMRATSPDTPL